MVSYFDPKILYREAQRDLEKIHEKAGGKTLDKCYEYRIIH